MAGTLQRSNIQIIQCTTVVTFQTTLTSCSFLNGHFSFSSSGVNELQSVAECYLLMVKGCRACCCLGMPMMLGDDRLGLPILLLLPAPTPPAPPLSPPTPTPPTIPADCPVGPPTCWLWFMTLRLLIGKIPLQRGGTKTETQPRG